MLRQPFDKSKKEIVNSGLMPSLSRHQEITLALKETLENLGLPVVEPNLEHPAEENHGDYSTNIAMVAFRLAKGHALASAKMSFPQSHVIPAQAGIRKPLDPRVKPEDDNESGMTEEFKNPLVLAQAIAANFPKTAYLEKVEAVAPGFINFWLKPAYIYNSMLSAIRAGDEYGKSSLQAGQKIMVEFAQPNPFKEFHIGHLRNISLGESACRLFENLGATVKRVNYEGDVGMHVAKALYGIMRKNSFAGRGLAKLKTLDEKVKFLGEAYAAGSKAFEEEEAAKKEIVEINKKIYAGKMKELYQTTKKWSLDYFETIYKRLGTKFDFYYFESVVGEYGVKIVKEYLKKGVFEESEGAVVFKGEKVGLHTRVFLNSFGLPTYEAKDLSLPLIKYEDFHYDSSIIQTGNEQAEYFKVMLAALSQINPDLAAKTRNQTFGMVNLKSGKMSSRTGQVVTANWLLDEVKKKLQAAYKMKNEVAEIVAVAAVKYSMLKVNVTQDIAFDIDESINLEGDSGPYLQYAYARCRSVILKSVGAIHESPERRAHRDAPLQYESEELSLLRTLYLFPEIVASAGIKYSPNLLCGYLFGLAQKFNLFYNRCSILKPETGDTSDGGRLKRSVSHDSSEVEGIKNFRLALTAATSQILKNGLNLLGIKTVEKM